MKLLCVVTVIAIGWLSTEVAAQTNDCFETALTQREMKECACAKAESALQDLDAQFAALFRLHAEDTEILARLREAQLAFASFRKAHVAALHAANSGSVAPMCACLSVQELTATYADQLRPSDEGEACAWQFKSRDEE